MLAELHLRGADPAAAADALALHFVANPHYPVHGVLRWPMALSLGSSLDKATRERANLEFLAFLRDQPAAGAQIALCSVRLAQSRVLPAISVRIAIAWGTPLLGCGLMGSTAELYDHGSSDDARPGGPGSRWSASALALEQMTGNGFCARPISEAHRRRWRADCLCRCWHGPSGRKSFLAPRPARDFRRKRPVADARFDAPVSRTARELTPGSQP